MEASTYSRWISGIAAGSGAGVLYWHLASQDHDAGRPLVSFDQSTAATTAATTASPEPVVECRRSGRKLGLPADVPNYLFGDAYRRRVFFNYEKRIRLRSPPEKVFAYFASVRTPKGELLMKPGDLMRAVVPVFPPSESHVVRDGYLFGERSPGELYCAPSEFFLLFDMNSDGLISFKEYIFFVTLLSIPESSFSVAFKMFDLNNNGDIDKEEFKKVMNLMRAHNRQGAHHRDGLRTGFKVSGTVKEGGLLKYFFGEDGQERLPHDKFLRFMGDLRSEILNLEFDHYDYHSQGTISAQDFALSLVASADMGHLHKLLDRVDELGKKSHLKGIRITRDEFKSFAELRRKLQPFSLAIFSFGEVNGLLTKRDFQRAALQVCDVALSDNVVEVIFQVFDANRDGNISSKEFVRVVHKRQKDIAHPVGEGLAGILSCVQNCGKTYTLECLIP
ncbi:hypothetical protein MLD38_013970 [Melastoma candidum]|uniref:Uncharacterized protein n=1 Tax=Melastoma candidum TaxID=119954 RepID=A0ACB9RB87_9MYRT|nr:hypothetical protein MLD38_013970 [Melastoma candidum]